MNSFCSRFRDYTPGKDELFANIVKELFGYNGEFGGASDYLSLIKKEILPFMDHEYHVKMNDLSIMGYSLGGLFVLYALFNEPDLFQSYVAMSPYLEFKNPLIFQMEEKFSEQNKKLPISLFLSVGLEEDDELGPGMVSNVIRLTNAMKSREYQELKLVRRVLEGYVHNDVVPVASIEALKFLYGN